MKLTLLCQRCKEIFKVDIPHCPKCKRELKNKVYEELNKK